MVLAFAEDAGLDPAEVVVIGDNPHVLSMAREAGAGAAIGVTSGNSRADDLAPLADAVLPSVRELPAWLAANRG
jgi:phosphoglycolate phosphatase